MSNKLTRVFAISCIFILASCGEESADSGVSVVSSEESSQAISEAPAAPSTQNDIETCLASVSSARELDVLEAQLACPMSVTERVTVKLVGTDETYGCEPRVVAVAPKDSGREYVRIALTHGTPKEYTAVVRLQNGVLSDRKSGWRNYGWPGNPPLEPCSELPMKVVSITCKVSGAQEFQPCEQDVRLLPPGLFLSEEL